MLTTTYADKGSDRVASIASTQQYVFTASIFEAEEAEEMHGDISTWNAMGC